MKQVNSDTYQTAKDESLPLEVRYNKLKTALAEEVAKEKELRQIICEME